LDDGAADRRPPRLFPKPLQTYMTVSVARAGATVAEDNPITTMQLGRTACAYVVASRGRLVVRLNLDTERCDTLLPYLPQAAPPFVASPRESLVGAKGGGR
jgi:hypothetical protein